MVLVDQGLVHLEEPVDAWLPELADRRMLAGLDAQLDDTVPALRPITSDDLLTFRLGFGVIIGPPGAYPIQIAEEELQLKTLGPWPPTPHTPDEWMQRLGTLPLMHQPGEHWMYTTGAQVLGVLLERVVGKPLETFLGESLFAPLGMDDTAFSVLPGKLDRLTTAYAPRPISDALELLDGVEDSYWSCPPAFPNAAGWLVSTIDDYWAFALMMLSDGVYDGERVLSEGSVRLRVSPGDTDGVVAQERRGGRTSIGDSPASCSRNGR
jgi:CubicO group peptidase (beta-lactamase class C family)